MRRNIDHTVIIKQPRRSSQKHDQQQAKAKHVRRVRAHQTPRGVVVEDRVVVAELLHAAVVALRGVGPGEGRGARGLGGLTHANTHVLNAVHTVVVHRVPQLLDCRVDIGLVRAQGA